MSTDSSSSTDPVGGGNERRSDGLNPVPRRGAAVIGEKRPFVDKGRSSDVLPETEGIKKSRVQEGRFIVCVAVVKRQTLTLQPSLCLNIAFSGTPRRDRCDNFKFCA